MPNISNDKSFDFTKFGLSAYFEQLYFKKLLLIGRY